MSDKDHDANLVERFKKGETEALSELISRYGSKIFNLALRITRHHDDAEDILQDVFSTLLTKMSSFHGHSAFSSWLYRVTANTAFMRLRSKRVRAALSFEQTTFSEHTDFLIDRSDHSDVGYISTRHELRAALERAISALPLEYRTVFLLRDVDGLSNLETSTALKVSVAAVKSRLHRSRCILRKQLREFYLSYTEVEDASDEVAREPLAELQMAA